MIKILVGLGAIAVLTGATLFILRQPHNASRFQVKLRIESQLVSFGRAEDLPAPKVIEQTFRAGDTVTLSSQGRNFVLRIAKVSNSDIVLEAPRTGSLLYNDKKFSSVSIHTRETIELVESGNDSLTHWHITLLAS